MRNHRLAFGLAVLVGAIYCLPHLLFLMEAGESYRYPFTAMPDERHYASRIHEIYDGHYAIANPDLKEYKDSPYFWQPLCEILVGGLGKLFGISIENLLVLSDFLFPLVLFLLMYGLASLLTESKMLAILAASAILMASILIFGPPQSLVYWASRLSFLHLNPLMSPKSSFLFSRSINPQCNLVFFFAFLLAIHGVIVRGKQTYSLLAGILMGAFFYCSFYYWSYAMAGSGILGCYLFFKKDLRTLWNLCIVILIGLLLSVPYWVGFHELQTSPAYEEVVRRTYFVASHGAYLPKLEILAVVTFIVFCPVKDRSYVFLASFLLGGLLCENQQILTGKKMHPYHWSLYCQAPLAWIAYALFAKAMGERGSGRQWVSWIRKHGRGATAVLVALMLFNAIHTQFVYVYAKDREEGPRPFYERSLPRWLYYQRYEPVLTWLNTNASRDTVILTSTDVSSLVTAFTHCNILVGWHTHIYLVPDQELLERWLLKSYFFDVPAAALYDVLEPNLDGLCELCPWRFREDDRVVFRKDLENVYATMKQKSLLALLEQYHVEYVICSASEREEFRTEERGFDVSDYPFIREIVRSGDIALYKVETPSVEDKAESHL